MKAQSRMNRLAYFPRLQRKKGFRNGGNYPLFLNDSHKPALAGVVVLRVAARHFLETVGQSDSFDQVNEVRILRELREQIQQKLPVPPIDDLRNQLQHAVDREEYEEAARLRDEIRQLEAGGE